MTVAVAGCHSAEERSKQVEPIDNQSPRPPRREPKRKEKMATSTPVSPESVEEQAQWDKLESMMMGEALASHENQCNAGASASKRASALLGEMSDESRRLKSSSRDIANGISSSIESERLALSDESSELSRRASAVHGLEREAASLRDAGADLLARRREAEGRIPLHAAVASEQVSELEEVQHRHVRTLPKIKNELSLHAVMTNIKWDYNRSDVLAGEVAIPSRAVHRRFEIERDDLSEFEIAERLWDMIGSE